MNETGGKIEIIMKKTGVLFFLLLMAASVFAQIAFKPAQPGVYAQMVTNKGSIIIKLFADLTPRTVANFIGLAEGSLEWTDPVTGKKQSSPFYTNLTFHRLIKGFMIQGGCPLGTGTGGPGYRFEDEIFHQGEALEGKIENEEVALLVWQQVIAPFAGESQGKVADEKLQKIIDDVVTQQSGKPIVGNTVEFFLQATGRKGPVFRQELIHPVAYGTLCMANSGPDSNGSQFFIVTKKEGCSWLNGKHTVFGEVIQGMETVHKIESVTTDAADKPKERVYIIEVKIIRKEI